jgi:hypothetical protein
MKVVKLKVLIALVFGLSSLSATAQIMNQFTVGDRLQ